MFKEIPTELSLPLEIVPFNFENKYEIRTVLDRQTGDPLFVAKDICDVLEIKNPTQAVRQLDDDERAMQNIGRQGKTNIINESGLYALIMRSNKPQAKPFRKWVTSEVLPSIRKHGAYMTPDILENAISDPNSLVRILEGLKEERTKRIEAEKMVTEMKPKADFIDAVTPSEAKMTLSDYGRVLKDEGKLSTGAQKIFGQLRELGVIQQISSMPYDRYVNQGWFEIGCKLLGSVMRPVAFITLKGQQAVYTKLKESLKTTEGKPFNPGGVF